MKGKKLSASSSRWLQKHFSDKYVQQKQKKRLHSRAWFKLAEIQQSDKIFKTGITIVDLGSAPGGWSQYAVNQIGRTGRIIACDLLPMNPIVGVDFILGDCRDELVRKTLLELVGDNKVQVVMSDMAPNMCGIPSVDIPRAGYLVELALEMCRDALATGGSFIVKMFQGEGFEEYLKEISSLFKKVKVRKPDSSRASSREVYIVATEHKLKLHKAYFRRNLNGTRYRLS